MSQGHPQDLTSLARIEMDSEPVSRSTEDLFDSVMRSIVKSSLPVLRIRGTHKSSSYDHGECVDFDLSLTEPRNMLREYLVMDGISYDPVHLDDIQDRIRDLCDRFQTRPEADHSIIFRVRTTCQFTDEEPTRSYVISLCTALRYAGTIEVVMENNSAISTISAPETRTEKSEEDEVHVIEARWTIHWPLTNVIQDRPEHHQQLELWRRGVGDAIVGGEQGVIALDTMQATSGKSLLRKAMAQRNLSLPISKRTDENGVTWTESSVSRWGMDET